MAVTTSKYKPFMFVFFIILPGLSTYTPSQGSTCYSDTSLPLNRQELVQVPSSSATLGQNYTHCITSHNDKPATLSRQGYLFNTFPEDLNSVTEKSGQQDSGTTLDNKNKMKLFEQIQLHKSRMSHKEDGQGSSGSGSNKTQIGRQDSGLGTLSTVSNLF